MRSVVSLAGGAKRRPDRKAHRKAYWPHRNGLLNPCFHIPLTVAVYANASNKTAKTLLSVCFLLHSGLVPATKSFAAGEFVFSWHHPELLPCFSSQDPLHQAADWNSIMGYFSSSLQLSHFYQVKNRGTLVMDGQWSRAISLLLSNLSIPT